MRSLSTLLLLLSVFSIYAQQLLRGPYLQSPTDNSIVIKWRTDQATATKVWYGTDPNDLQEEIVINNSVTDHEVLISSLAPEAKYYYAVGYDNTKIVGGDGWHHFRTHPMPGTVTPTRIWVIGDMGKANQGQHDVWESYMEYTKGSPTDVWLWMGDNAYDDGTDAEYQAKIFDDYYGYDSIFRFLPFYPVPGNHDYNSVNRLDDPTTHNGPYFDIMTLPEQGEAGGTPSGSELYYSFDYGNVHFLAINSELQEYTGALDLGGFGGSPMTQWLEQDLQNNDKEWVIAYFHQPPYSKGSHDSDDFFEVFMEAMRENIIPILEQYNVDLVLNGHSHVYERSYLINGHYGDSDDWDPNQHLVNGNSGNFDLGEHYVKYLHPDSAKGTIYSVCGNAGSSRDQADLDYPAMYFGDAGQGVYGSLVIDVDGNRLDAKYLRSNGNILDEFTIIKPDGSTPVSIEEITPRESGDALAAYPNPFDEMIYVEFAAPKRDFATVGLYNAEGKLIQKIYEGIVKPSNYRYEVDAVKAKLTAGVYYITATQGDFVITTKVVKL